MAGFSDTMEQRILNGMFKAVAFVEPAALYISLHSAEPTDVPASNELAGNGYARVTTATGNWTVSAGQAATNAELSFPTATTAPWNSGAAIKFFGLWDSSTLTAAANFMGYGSINGSTGVIVLVGNVLVFPSGSLTFTLD